MQRSHRPHPDHHHAEALLPSTVQHAQTGIRLTQAQLRRVGLVLGVLMFLFLGSSFHGLYRAQQRHTALSNCPARLAALGMDLNAASLDRAHFATSSSTDLAILQHGLTRRRLYEHLAADLQRKGLSLGGVVTQGLVQADLFQLLPPTGRWAGHGRVKPILHPLQTPVRAVVLPLLDHEAAHQLHSTVKAALLQLLAPDSIWWQDPTILHVTLYHASDHTDPVPAAHKEVQQEIAAVAAVVAATCPLRVVLDRLAITAAGVVIACWQVLPGSGEPAALRAALAGALPHAPPAEQQVIKHREIFHMTLARLLAPAKHGGTADGAAGAQSHEVWNLAVLQQALADVAADLSDELCGLVTEFQEAWFVEEEDLLALGLGGRYTQHHAGQFSCPRQ